MPATDLQHLRVLIANEKRDRLDLLAQVVIGLGHDVIAREIYVKEVGAQTAREQPDVAIVGLGLSSEHALDLIGEIVREASCPVIALLHANDPAYIREAAKRFPFGRFALPSPIPSRCRQLAPDRSIFAAVQNGRDHQGGQHRGIQMSGPALDPPATSSSRRRPHRRLAARLYARPRSDGVHGLAHSRQATRS